MLVKEVADPRLSGISITDVKVDRELAFADIYVSAIEGHERSKEIIQGLQSASGFLRHELATRVDLRVFPRLRFHWDPTPERADQIERVLSTLREEEEARQQQAEADGSASTGSDATDAARPSGEDDGGDE